MASNDVFAPPTREELKFSSQREGSKGASGTGVFAPPTEDELSAFPGKPGFLSKMGDKALDGLEYVGQKYDQYFSAPARAGLGILTGMDTSNYEFFEDPRQAPRGDEIAKHIGFSDQPKMIDSKYGRIVTKRDETGKEVPLKISDADAVGLGIDMGADPLNVVPFSGLLKGATKAATKGAGFLLKKGANLATGSAVPEKVMGGMADSMGDLWKQYFKAERADDFQEMATIAERLGIPFEQMPEAAEFGKDSMITRMAKVQAEGPQGAKYIEKYRQANDAIQNSMNQRIANYTKNIPTNEATAGEVLKQGFDDFTEELFSQMDMTYATVHRQVPGLKLTDDAWRSVERKLNGMERWAKGRLKRGIGSKAGKTQARQLLSTINAVRATKGNYKQVVEALSDIGQEAFQSRFIQGDIPADVRRMRTLYRTISDSLIDTTRTQLGDDIADSLIQNNETMTKFFRDKSALGNIIVDDKSPEKVFRQLILNGTKKQAEALKNVLPPETLEYLKGAFLENLLRRGPDQEFPYRSAFNSLKRRDSVANVLFSPEEIASISDDIRFGDRIAGPFMSTSGTGASNAFRGFLENVKSVPINESTIGAMKQRARDAHAMPLPGGDFTKGLLRNRGKFGTSAKGSQVYSVQSQPEEDQR